MADLIEVKGIKAFGYHGVFESERKSGQIFYVDLALELDLTLPSMSDEVTDTVNYAALIDLVLSEVTGEPVSLIEKLAGRIAHLIKSKYPQIRSASVTVHKPQAPVGAEVTDISVTLKR